LENNMTVETQILPPHIEDTVKAIAKLHADHHLESGKLQRFVERLTGWIGRPQSIALLAGMIIIWATVNLLVVHFGEQPWDPAPFPWLQDALAVLALFVTVLILTTQRRDDQLASYREQLTLELAILGEQKSAKIISLLEELRRDSPNLHSRVDEQAREMSVAADPEAILMAIKDTQIVTDSLNG
jgi:uncharacterized membrane protein